MPKINVYLPDDLARAVREAGIPISAVCQRALADAVAAADGTTRSAAESPDDQPGDRWQLLLTDRARRVFDLAIEAAGNRQSATSVHLIEALVEQGHNLALGVLRSLDIDSEDLLSELRATVSAARRAGEVTAASIWEVGERAAQAAVELDNNFVGCEHLLLGILNGSEEDPARATLGTLGVDLAAAQHAVRAALSGYSFAQGNLSLSGLSAPVRSILEEFQTLSGGDVRLAPSTCKTSDAFLPMIRVLTARHRLKPLGPPRQPTTHPDESREPSSSADMISTGSRPSRGRDDADKAPRGFGGSLRHQPASGI